MRPHEPTPCRCVETARITKTLIEQKKNNIQVVQS